LEHPKEHSYLKKLKGAKVRSGLAYPSLRVVIVSGIGVTIAIGTLTFLTFAAGPLCVSCFIIPFGASAFLVFAAPAVPFAQPRSVLGGHFLSALVGVLCYTLFGSSFWVAGLSCGLATAFMVATKTWHPPAAATAVVPVLNSIRDWLWVFYPTSLGAMFLVVLGLLYNNLVRERTYPEFWI
jgi:CBS-domain-containing membrane protein